MKILLGVCGSISAYKTFDLTRGWVKRGHQVRVVLTRGALEFVQPKLYRYLGVEAVYTSDDDFNFPSSEEDLPGNVLHIELGKWADQLVIAPLSANTGAKLSHGEAGDLLSSIFLAMEQDKPISVFPAMNTKMLSHPFTQENLDKLNGLPQLFIHPTASGLLACGDEGAGKLPDVEKIMDVVEAYNPHPAKKQKKILISTGATISPLDPVRYLTNASSGLTGYYLAKEALMLGHKVIMVAGKNATAKLDHFEALPNFKLMRVTTTSDMKDKIGLHLKECDVYISSAAINDIEFESLDGKMKKSAMGESLPIKKASDVLQMVLNEKREDQKVVGFAAETNLSKDVLEEKWNRKPVDLLVGTWVHSGLTSNGELSGFAKEEARYSLMDKTKNIQTMALSKKDLAHEILSRVTND